MEEIKQNETFYCHCDLSFFSAYFIQVYVSFIIVKNYVFVMGFAILAIYFQLKTTIFNVKT